MSKCKQCNVLILDDTEVCPLCRCVIDKDKNATNKYPDIYEKQERFKLAVRIYAFAAIVAEILCIYINYKYFDGILWSIISGCILAYVYLTLAVFIDSEKLGYRMKTLVGALALVATFVSADFVTGNNHWSFNYVIPTVISLGNIAILILILFINRKFWQSYIIVQIIVLAISLCQYILYAFGLATDLYHINISIIFSALCLLGTIIIGGRRSIAELKRRFHF